MKSAVNHCMKPSVFIVAIYIFFLTFSLLSLFFGETGVTALDRIRNRNHLLSGNIDLLDMKQGNLVASLTMLRSDPDSIVVEARALGLYRKNERVIQFRNLNPVHSLPDAGKVLHLSPVSQTDESLLRIIAASSGIIFLLFSLLLWKLRDAVQTK